MFSKSISRFAQYMVTPSERLISYYITTPIFYVNASPHIGHVHTLFLADALNIYNRLRLKNDSTIFSTGTDEHGIKIQSAAELNKTSPQDFCDTNSAKFSNLFRHYGTTVTDFIRTTEKRHELAVQSMWNTLDKNGYIYKSRYAGWYCSSDEAFVPESQVSKKEVDGRQVHVDSNDNVLTWSSEENYMFRLSRVEEEVKSWLTVEKPVVPAKFNDIVLKSIEKTPVGDISISRPTSRLEWGVRVPGDQSQTIYVWLDALASYLTVAGYPCDTNDLRRWPIDCQVLGKDIIKFHAIYWPAFLMAMSLPPPRRLICHSHWTVDDLKMSKSRGNVRDPWQENKLLTEEGLRYYLLRASTNHSDNDYSRVQAVRRINAELADTYGNLMSRCCGKAINPKQEVSKCLIESQGLDPIQELIEELRSLPSTCESHFDNADFCKGIDQIMHVLRLNNKLYEDSKPWKLVKMIESDSEAFIKYQNIQAITFETLRICSILLQPIVPILARRALSNMGTLERAWEDARIKLGFGCPSMENVQLPNKADFVLFRRLKAQ